MGYNKKTELTVLRAAVACGYSADAGASDIDIGCGMEKEKTLSVELLVIDLDTCKRCVPTGELLRQAIALLEPVAAVLGIVLKHREIVVQTPQEAKELALVSSPTIRLNGRDIAQDIRESRCESCGELTGNSAVVNCREWHYRGRVYSAAPLPLLIESIMAAMLNMEIPPVVPAHVEELPENLQRYFDNRRQTAGCC